MGIFKYKQGGANIMDKKQSKEDFEWLTDTDQWCIVGKDVPKRKPRFVKGDVYSSIGEEGND